MSANIPQNAVSGEGDTLNDAVKNAAAKIGLSLGEVEHRLDLDHFRNAQGINVGADTVKVWVWPLDGQLVAASKSAREYIAGLLEAMGFEAEVSSRLQGKDVIIQLKTENAGPIVGRQGVTLDAILTLLETTIGQKFPEQRFRIDVADNRPRRDDDEGGRGRSFDDRPRGRGSDDRPRGRGSDDRPRERSGGDRDRPRGRRRSSEGDDRSAAVRMKPDDEKKLRRMAAKVAERVLETGEAELIRKELNSFARRVVHITVSEYEGLRTESVGEGSHKQIRVAPAGGVSNEDVTDADTD